MFVLTQLIGLAVVSVYTPVYEQVEINGTLTNVTVSPQLPYGMQPPEIDPQLSLTSIIVAFVIAISLVLLLTKLKAKIFLRLWFFVVVVLVLGITLNALFANFLKYNLEITAGESILALSIPALISFIIALPLAIFKIFKRNILIHNITEVMIYPGIAAVFVPILNLWTVIALLILISIYDMWAVWHTGFMQKMAKFQINEMKIFGGFFLPYLGKKQKSKVKLWRQQIKDKKTKAKDKKKLKEKKIKVNLAILGGGDVVFPIITAGVVMALWGLIPALIVTLCATIALFLLFLFSQKSKFYPAMPFITSGLFIGMILGYLWHLFI